MKYYINQMIYKNIQTVISTLKTAIYYCSFFILISCSSTIEFSFSNEGIKDELLEYLSMNLHQGKVFFLFENSMNETKVSIKSNNFGVDKSFFKEKINTSDYKVVEVFSPGDYLLMEINNISIELPISLSGNYRFVFIKRCPKNKRKFIITFTNEISQEVLSQI